MHEVRPHVLHLMRGQGDDLGPGGDLIPRQVVGVALAIPPLMVVPGDVAGVAEDVLQLGDALQDGHALDGVAFYDLAFLRRELARSRR